MEQSFDITLYTTMGEKHGVMVMEIDNWTVHGFIYVLGKKQPFNGELDSNGNCILSGQLVTPVRAISYTAVGMVDEYIVELSLQLGHNKLRLAGLSNTQTGGDADAKNL